MNVEPDICPIFVAEYPVTSFQWASMLDNQWRVLHCDWERDLKFDIMPVQDMSSRITWRFRSRCTCTATRFYGKAHQVFIYEWRWGWSYWFRRSRCARVSASSNNSCFNTMMSNQGDFMWPNVEYVLATGITKNNNQRSNGKLQIKSGHVKQQIFSILLLWAFRKFSSSFKHSFA